MIFVRLLFIVCYLIQLAIHGDAKGGESLGSSEGVNNERIASATELNVTVNILLLTVAQKGGIMDKKDGRFDALCQPLWPLLMIMGDSLRLSEVFFLFFMPCSRIIFKLF